MTRTIDQAKSEAFAEKLLATINGAALTLMVSVGHRTRLFDAMASAGPLTSEQLAERAGLSERYVREWLGAMATGGIVEHDHRAGTYTLPAEHAAWLTRAAAPNRPCIHPSSAIDSAHTPASPVTAENPVSHSGPSKSRLGL